MILQTLSLLRTISMELAHPLRHMFVTPRGVVVAVLSNYTIWTCDATDGIDAAYAATAAGQLQASSPRDEVKLLPTGAHMEGMVGMDYHPQLGVYLMVSANGNAKLFDAR